MDGLVDYSDSEGSSNEQESTVPSVLARASSVSSSIAARLPPPHGGTRSSATKRKAPREEAPLDASPTTDALDDRRDWEKELAQRVAAEKPRTSGKRKLFAFGALTKKSDAQDADESDEEEEDLTPSTKPSSANISSTSELLNILPAPQAATKKLKTTSGSLMPHVLRERLRKPPPPAPRALAANAAAPAAADSDEDEADASDFFGFKTSRTQLPAVPAAARVPLAPQARIYDDHIAPGPARPQPVAAEKEDDDVESSVGLKRSKHVSDEQAAKLIYKSDLAPWGLNDSAAREAVINMKTVNVDEQLGPNVRETLLRNLNNKAMAQVALGPLPSVKKDDKDKLAKQKHQITHLARVAVSREEHLQEAWAEGRAKKRETASRYGF